MSSSHPPGSSALAAPRPLRVLALCMSNICRSPLAEALLRRELSATGIPAVVTSAGTDDGQVGRPADPRSRELGRRHGLELAGRARQLRAADFDQHDLILAMDRHNLAAARRLAPPAATARLQLLRDFDPQGRGEDVRDPYAGGVQGFEDMYVVLERSAREFARQVAAGEWSPVSPEHGR